MSRSKSDGPQESAAELARKRLVSERLMSAAAVHRHTPEGYSGLQRREEAAEPRAVPDAAERDVAAVTATHGVEVDDERVVADPTSGGDAQAAKRPALPLGLPADILALDLNVGAASESASPADVALPSAKRPALPLGLPADILALDLNLDEPSSPCADVALPAATGPVDPDRQR